MRLLTFQEILAPLMPIAANVSSVNMTEPPHPKSLHLIDTTGPGGAETLFIEIAEHLINESAQTLALVRGPGWLANTLKQKGIPYLMRDRKGSFNVRYLCYLCMQIRNGKFDIVHAHLLGSSVYGSLAGLLTKRPVLTTFHGLVDIKPDDKLARTKLAIVRRGSSIVAVSEAIKANLVNKFSLRSEEVTVIPNGINCDQFDTSRNQALRRKYGLSNTTTIIGALGNVRLAKDYGTAIHAIKTLRNSGSDVHFFIAGDPNQGLMELLFSLIGELDLHERVHFLGFIDDANHFLSSIDIFLSSSLSEGQPLSIFQAMSKGLPIVASRSGVEAFLRDGESAWLASVKSPNELAEQLQHAINSVAERNRRGENARSHVLRHHDRKIMFMKYQALYRKLNQNR